MPEAPRDVVKAFHNKYEGSPHLEPTVLRAKRWGWITTYSVVGAAAVLVMEYCGAFRPLAPLIATIAGLLERRPVPSSITSFAITLLVLAPTARRQFGASHFWRRPPLWAAAWVGALFVVVYHFGNSAGDSDGILNLVFAFLICAAIGLATLVVMALTGRMDGNESRPARTRSTAAASTKWYLDDSEVVSPDMDRFGHDEVAARIARRLRLGQAGGLPTIALIGARGSGKSSICNLVRSRLQAERSQVRIVRISLWPFDTPEAAVRGVLSAVVGEIGKHCDTLTVGGVPASYLSIVEGLGGSWASVLTTMTGEQDPASTLDQLSEVIQTLGLHVVVWVEDLERFAGGEPLASRQLAIREAERLEPLRALLYLLDNKPGISAIIADTTLRTRMDVDKIARFIEHPPKLRAVSIWRQIIVQREAGADDDLLPATAGLKSAIFEIPSDPAHLESWTGAWSIHFTTPQEALAVLIETPRVLKTLLRLIDDSWNCLRGEICYDDVIVASTLRASCPEVFAFVDDNIDDFRTGFQLPDHSGGKSKEKTVSGRLKSVLTKETELRQTAIVALLRVLFPGYETRVPRGLPLLDPQRLAVKWSVDNWVRFTGQRPPVAAQSDQMLLRDLKAWKNGDSNGLVDRLADPVRANHLTAFARHVSGAELLRLLSEWVDRLREKSASHWRGSDEAPGLSELSLMVPWVGPDPQEYCDRIKHLLASTVGTNLPLASSLYHRFGVEQYRREGPLVVHESDLGEMRRVMQESLVKRFEEGRPEQFVAAMREGSSYVPLWLSWGLDRLRSNDTKGMPFEGWTSFAGVLLATAEVYPEVGIPVLAAFIVTPRESGLEEADDEGGPGSTGRFDESLARRLFNFERLVVALSRGEVVETPTTAEEDRARTAVLAARRLLGPIETRPNLGGGLEQ